MAEEIKCPICQKGKLFDLCGLFTCCYCEKAWQEHEFIHDCKEAGLTVEIDDRGITIKYPAISSL